MELKTSNIVLLSIGAAGLTFFLNWVFSPLLCGFFSRNLLIFWLTSVLLVVIPLSAAGVLALMRRGDHAVVFLAALGLLLLVLFVELYWFPLLRVPYL